MTTMQDIKFLLVSLLIMATAASLQAQEQDPYGIRQLQDSLQRLRSDVSNLHKRIDHLHAPEPAPTVAPETSPDPLEALTRQIKDSLSVLKELQKQDERLTKETSNYGQQIEQMQSRLSSYDEIRPELERTKVLRAKEYLQQIYSNIEIASLEEMLALARKYPKDKEIQAWVPRIKTAISNKKLYSKTQELVTRKYERAVCDETLIKMNELRLNDQLNETQKKDCDDVYRPLSRYKAGVEGFQALVKEVRKHRGEPWKQLQELMDKQLNTKKAEEKFSAWDRITSVPYLREKLKAYQEDLKKDSSAESPVEQEILGLKTK